MPYPVRIIPPTAKVFLLSFLIATLVLVLGCVGAVYFIRLAEML